jgi:hypothetical protein
MPFAGEVVGPSPNDGIYLGLESDSGRRVVLLRQDRERSVDSLRGLRARLNGREIERADDRLPANGSRLPSSAALRSIQQYEKFERNRYVQKRLVENLLRDNPYPPMRTQKPYRHN